VVLHGRHIQPPSMQERRSVIEEHLRLLIVHKERAGKSRRHPQNSAELSAVLHFRAHLVGYIKGVQEERCGTAYPTGHAPGDRHHGGGRWLAGRDSALMRLIRYSSLTSNAGKV